MIIIRSPNPLVALRHPLEKMKYTGRLTWPYCSVVFYCFKIFFSQIPGLCEALKNPKSGVSTIFAPEYCEKTFTDLQAFQGGDAIFTYPDSPIKCPGAPQKIAYLADSYMTKVS